MDYKAVKYNWHMRRTYILVGKWSFMPPKDRRLTFFMLVRIICLNEKGQTLFCLSNLKEQYLLGVK